MPVLSYNGADVEVTPEEMAVLDSLQVKWIAAGRPFGIAYANAYERRIWTHLDRRFAAVGWDGRPTHATVTWRDGEVPAAPLNPGKAFTCAHCGKSFAHVRRVKYCPSSNPHQSSPCAVAAAQKRAAAEEHRLQCVRCDTWFVSVGSMRRTCSACEAAPKSGRGKVPSANVDTVVRTELRRIRAAERIAAREEPVTLPAPVRDADDVPSGTAHLLRGEVDRRAAALIRQAPWSWARTRRSRRYEGFR